MPDAPSPSGIGDSTSHRNLREATLSGVRSFAGARLAIEALVFGSSIVLARLIPPAEYGHAVIALIVPMLASSVLPAVIASRVVQRKALDREHIEAASWLAVSTGSALSALTFLVVAPAIEPLFGAETADLVRLASPTFLLASFSITPMALLQRRLDFRRVSRIGIAGSAIGAATAVAAALAGLGAEAVVLGVLPGAALTSVLAIRAAGFVRPRAKRGPVSDLARFGVPAGVGALGTTSFRNIDFAIVGAQLGAAQLGAYWRGFQLAVEYQRKITVVMLRVAFPIYSRAEDRPRIRAIRTRIVRAHATAIYPLLALLVALAPQLIPFLYGPAWESAVVPAQILALCGLSVTAQSGLGPLLMGMGKTKPLMVYTLAGGLCYGVAILLAAPYGLTAVCVTAAASALAIFLAGRYLLESRIAGIPMRQMTTELGPGLASSGVLLALSWPLATTLAAAELPAVVVIAATAGAGLTAYAITLRWLFPAAWKDLRLLAGRVLGRAERPEPGPAVAPATESLDSAPSPASA